MKSVLVVADVPWWAFGKIYRGLKDNLTTWQVDVHYARHNPVIKHHDHDVVFFLCDHLTELLDRNKIPAEKTVLAIRSESLHPTTALRKKARVIAVANEELQEKFSRVHSKVMLAPGGVDTDKFYFKQREVKGSPVVGWAGSIRNFGEEFRGIPLIREACKRRGFEFRPALREENLRTENEMVKYYHDIDLYVDMSVSAGRQNGVLEAGSCGLPVVFSNTGLAKSSLIKHGDNALISDRDPNILAAMIQVASDCTHDLGRHFREDIEKEWSWKKQAPLFEAIFEEVFNG